MRINTLLGFLSLLSFVSLLTACSAAGSSPAPVLPSEAEPLVIYGWSSYMPQTILDAFTAEFGTPIDYRVYADQEEALMSLRAGAQYDIVILSNVHVPLAVSAGLLAEIDHENIPNLRNLGAAFRNLAYDPESRYSVMIQWGTTGIVARSDRLVAPLTSWNDLWNPAYAGKIGIWPYPTDLVGIALKSLGYSCNSEDPQELQEAEEKLLRLRRNVFIMDPALSTGVDFLLDDQAVMVHGWSYDAMVAREKLAASIYVVPKEGSFFWTDNVTIPRNSPHRSAAEQFINFLLRPQISAQMVNELWVPSANEAARAFIDPQVLSNPLVYPPVESLRNVEFPAVLSEATLRRHAEIWANFLAEEGPQQPSGR
jgi:spermidine/putrescine transport system substrate-binding protein